jgi:hypothetical protein
MATVTPNFNWPVPTSGDLVKNGATAIEALGDGIDASFVDLKGGTTGQVLSKASNTDLDYSWVTTDDANAIQNSIVDAKGDLISATANDTPARLAVGNNGETLVADSSATTGLRYVATPSASNPIINSTFNVWQRGTSISVPSAFSTYAADRFQVFNAGANEALTVARQPTSDTTNLPFIQYCTRFQRNSGQTGTTLTQYGQTLESINSIPFAGKTITFSFYARKGADFSATSNTLAYSVQSGTGTDQNVFTGFTGATNVIAQGATLTTTWQRFTFTSTSVVPITATQLGLQFAYTPTGTAGANDYYEVTGVQIDVGSVALPFRTAGVSYQEELAMCQRYYFRVTAGAGGYQRFGAGLAYTSTLAEVIIPFPVSMRIKPTALEQSGTAGNYATVRANSATDALTSVPAFSTSTLNSSTINCNSANLVSGNATFLCDLSSDAFLGWSAEL